MSIRDDEERIERFFKKLDDVMEITARQLNDRFDFLSLIHI